MYGKKVSHYRLCSIAECRYVFLFLNHATDYIKCWHFFSDYLLQQYLSLPAITHNRWSIYIIDININWPNILNIARQSMHYYKFLYLSLIILMLSGSNEYIRPYPHF